MPDLKITSVESFLTQPWTSRHCVVRVNTSEPGLYGLGCATYTQRHLAVKKALDAHIGPFVVGKDPRHIEDLWWSAMVNGYWRNGPVLNNAVSGVDMALWDIKGKLANMPCYELWGGKVRPAALIYTHADGDSPEAVVEKAKAYQEQGLFALRCQLGGYWGIERVKHTSPYGVFPGRYYDPRERLFTIPKLFDRVRRELGETVELIHDVHERMLPPDMIRLAKMLEEFRLFFLEDVVAPEQTGWLKNVRQACATPLGYGELVSQVESLTPLVTERLIDFVRVHMSQIGGLTPSLKLARLCEAFGVRTAWHGPPDTSPVGMAACVHVDVACHNFGIQEWMFRPDVELEMFPGLPQYREGYVYPNDKPGLGIEFDEQLAEKYPCTDENPEWTVARFPDGTIWTP